MRWRVIFLVSAALASVSSVVGHEGASGVVRERMEAMESMGKSITAITQRLKQKRDLDAIKAHAKSIQEGAAKMPFLFPKGTGGHPSEATDQVWQKWADFEAKARALGTESGKLAEVDTRDMRALREQALRVSNVCGDCHELYRVKHHQHR